MRKLFVALLHFLSFPSLGQQIVREWVYKLVPTLRGFSTSSYTKEGNVILDGNYAANPGYQSIHMLVNPNLDTIWVKNGPLLGIGGTRIIQANSGGFAYYGTKKHVTPPVGGPILERLDANGNVKWLKNYPTGY